MNMDITDWRCISQHSVQAMIEAAVSRADFKSFAPTHLVAASTDALNVTWTLKKVVQSQSATSAPIALTMQLNIYDEDINPYNPVRGKYELGSFQGARVLLVDKADSSRVALANALAELQKTLPPDASVGVFVLHNKKRPKEGDLPPEVMEGRYFSAEESDNVAISYPYHQAALQPTAHGDHPHLSSGGSKRRSIDQPRRDHSHDQSVRVLSRHYIDEAIERAILDQKLLETFTPDLIIAVDETSISPASLLEHHIATKVGKKTPVLIPNWAVYEPDENPYKPVGKVWDQSDQSLAGFKILLVEKVDATRHTLTSFVESLTEKIAKQKAKEGSEWTEPKIGVFAFYNKENVASKSELPTGVSHFFAAESSSEGDIKISYPSG